MYILIIYESTWHILYTLSIGINQEYGSHPAGMVLPVKINYLLYQCYIIVSLYLHSTNLNLGRKSQAVARNVKGCNILLI